ncbi:hypothetical protein IGI04_014691 [Brassica rapa subsp. trilocularis]|uniref:Uncharacterized protein n=1 Tax=Brassica rapa subsp. trilocularis TaxID=1813537 RepID=A0ABQ7MMX8_BRACM|nr:hypothetical protein IGI04_014691 [Brassica rapa subsp. trilocularis]
MDGLRPKSGRVLVQNVLKHLLTEDLMEDQKPEENIPKCRSFNMKGHSQEQEAHDVSSTAPPTIQT